MKTEVKQKSQVSQKVLLGIAFGLVAIGLALSFFLFSVNEDEQQEVMTESPEYISGWPRESWGDFFTSDPSFANVDGNEGLEIIVGRLNNIPYHATSQVEIYQNNGAPLPNWPVEIQDPKIGSTIAHDIDLNGSQEILAISDHNVYVWLANGTPYPGNWPQPFLSNAEFPLNLGDIDGS